MLHGCFRPNQVLFISFIFDETENLFSQVKFNILILEQLLRYHAKFNNQKPQDQMRACYLLM